MAGERAEEGFGFHQHKWFSYWVLVCAKRIGGGLHLLCQALPSPVGSLLCSWGNADRISTKSFISPSLEWLKVGRSVSQRSPALLVV